MRLSCIPEDTARFPWSAVDLCSDGCFNYLLDCLDPESQKEMGHRIGHCRHACGGSDEELPEAAICDVCYVKLFWCMDCGNDTSSRGLGEYYMLTDQLWNSIVPESLGMLCIECVEARLGRSLVAGDFSDVPLNKWNRLTCSSEKLRAALDSA